MKNISPEICRSIGQARREQGISQSALARELGCKQPAISMFEAGDGTKLSEEVIKKFAEKVGVSLEPAAKKVADAVQNAMPALPSMVLPADALIGFCPSAHCLSNAPYVLEGRLFLRPIAGMAAPFVGAKRCAICGEVLETRCPSCGAPLNKGACCATCGMPYVTPTLPPEVDVAAWARARRAEMAELRSLQAL
ncbi:MAG: helix-turn-helix transcriptional regulator [Kiritimatiellae bacterium]|nr:helix-turn-helix transcriptional regulator [Kiritimatiellia bacterium]